MEVNKEVLKRNLEILDESNNKLINGLKQLKKKKTDEKPTKEEVMKDIGQLFEQVVDFDEQAGIRLPEFSIPMSFITSLESYSKPIDCLKSEYQKVIQMDEYRGYEIRKEKINAALEVLRSE